ncbi:protein transport protein Sec16A-like [Clupea harengus]|uniref:Protein transport protein Sec16A-like n=1 Tax=Clupea harengus TaxID=7950 RepID=A0A8M1KRQ5_CLUHA|nr:protein transport protein Sec16A-like [Clupea harengus]
MPAPADLFAPLAPMPILFTPNAAEEQQPAEGNTAEGVNQSQPQMFNPTLLPQCPEGTQSGELSRSSSMSSLSREVSHHLNQAPPTGGVTFYNPAQFAQAAPVPMRVGRLGGQREYPTLK